MVVAITHCHGLLNSIQSAMYSGMPRPYVCDCHEIMSVSAFYGIVCEYHVFSALSHSALVILSSV